MWKKLNGKNELSIVEVLNKEFLIKRVKDNGVSLIIIVGY